MMRVIRHIAPYILLAAYMPLLVALTFHTHSEEQPLTECSECAHHIHHRAHFDEAITLAHDCVYCQLTSSSYYSSESVSLPLRSDNVVTIANAVSSDIVPVSPQSASPRGPPLQ